MQTLNLALRPAPDKICPACTNRGLLLFFEVHNVPVDCTTVFDTREEAVETPHGDIILGLCEACGYIHNLAFDSSVVGNRGSYEDQQGFSPTFKKYAENLADDLICKYRLHNKLIVEIGCGKGDFLQLLCRRGRNRGIGIDPNADGKRVQDELGQLEFLNELYSEEHGRYRADLICCRHTLEHIHYPGEFVITIRRSILSPLNTPVVIELPDVTRVLDETAFWDIYYEHCGYYSPGTLARLFRRNGFEVADLQRVYQNQHLLLHTYPILNRGEVHSEIEESTQYLQEKVKSFSLRLKAKLERWAGILDSASGLRKRIVIWGSGSKCVGFLTALPNANEIKYVVDINPNRQGKYIPIFGTKIVFPRFLLKYQPNIVIVMNSIYLEEIKKDIRKMDLNPEILSV